MKEFGLGILGLFLSLPLLAAEANLVRYPHYHAGRITFTYLADV